LRFSQPDHARVIAPSGPSGTFWSSVKAYPHVVNCSLGTMIALDIQQWL
jgi:hypothetical protein